MTDRPKWQTPKQSEELVALRRAYQQHRNPPRIERLLPDMIYLCQLCAGRKADWPRERTYTFRLLFGKTWTVPYITPMVCSTCRIMRQPEVTRLGDGRRRFWKRVIALWLREPYPSMGPGMRRLFAYRNLLVKYPDPMSVLVILKLEWQARRKRVPHG
jgi:hypothetical protein